MKVEELNLRNFRNIEALSFRPAGGVNLITGDNAQGKTNLMEAVWLCTGCKSFRNTSDREMVRFGQKQAKIDLAYTDRKNSGQIEIEIEKNRKASLDASPLPSPSKLIGEFTAVVFSPKQLNLIQKGPEERRHFLDTTLCFIKPAYASVISNYRKLLVHRNILLRNPQNFGQEELLDAIEESMDPWVRIMIQQRGKYIEKIQEYASEFYAEMTENTEKLTIRYCPGVPENEIFHEILAKRRKTDRENGYTGKGPQRDDFQMEINGHSVARYGSQGQQRSAAIALKLAEAEIITKRTGSSPVILLDDVMSELDAKRQKFIFESIKDRQIFITCCDDSAIDRAKVEKRVVIRGGKI